MGSLRKYVFRPAYYIGRFIVHELILFLIAAVGVITVSNVMEAIQGDGPLPTFNPLPRHSYLQRLAHTNTTYDGPPSDEDYWESLQPSLRILNEVCPEVVEWVEDRHINNKIVIDREEQKYYIASYHMHGQLTLKRPFFEQSEGEKAITLVHEYRHSRQHWGKVVRGILSELNFDGGRIEIMEDDAERYEKQAWVAIFYGEYYNLLCE